MSSSSRPGTSAVTLISFSVSEISTLGKPPPKAEALPKDGRPKPRKASSNKRFTSVVIAQETWNLVAIVAAPCPFC
ncbi:hypothetical protein ACVITL_006789 [Rhizobium pisi]